VLEWIVPALLALNFLLLLWLAWRTARLASSAPQLQSAAQRELTQALDTNLQRQLDRLARELRDEFSRQAQTARSDLATFQQLLLAQGGDTTRTQNEQLDSFRSLLGATQQQLDAALLRVNQTLSHELRQLGDNQDKRLAALQEGNEKKLEQMRHTVDEKLQATLQQRLGESFRQVAERLEQVHKGLGEMQGLARDVGSLNRVLTNVKTRGLMGEMQLAALQYATNVATVPGSNDRVEFALRLPGLGSATAGSAAVLWLPIDAKFPREDYERLLDAQERADAPAAEASARAIEQRLRLEARGIRDKYLSPPHTTDFAILFVPTEGLYAEALRRPGLFEALQREFKVMLAGPTTLLATLNSLQMGFRTLALEKRSSEVWEVLGAVKGEFAKFGDVLAKTKKKLDEASSSIDMAQTRTQMMNRKLRAVESLPEVRALELLPAALDEAAPAGLENDAGR
jgi:DNA recombination protein RmuC